MAIITYEVGAGQTYTTFMAAYNALSMTSGNSYVLNIHAGTYPITTELTKSPVGNADRLTIQSDSGNYADVELTHSSTLAYGGILHGWIWKNVSIIATAAIYMQSVYATSEHLIEGCLLKTREFRFGGVPTFTVRNSIIVGTASFSYPIRISSNATSKTVHFYNNTIYTTGNVANLSAAGTTHEFHNNIFYSTQASNTILIAAPSSATPKFNNNLFYAPNAPSIELKYTGTTYTTLATWEAASSNIVDNVEGDPLFTDAGAEDFTIGTGSSAIDVGLDLSGSGVTEDLLGVARPVNTIFDIGAYEFDAPIEQGGNPLLCWQLTGKYLGSNRLFQLNGAGSYPKQIRIPSTVDKASLSLIDDSIEISKDNYKII